MPRAIAQIRHGIVKCSRHKDMSISEIDQPPGSDRLCKRLRIGRGRQSMAWVYLAAVDTIVEAIAPFHQRIFWV
jgi:hypothetical protein